MLVIAIIGHYKVVHSTTIRDGSTVEMSYKKGSLGVAIYVFRDKMVYPCTSVQGNVFACVAYMVVEQS